MVKGRGIKRTHRMRRFVMKPKVCAFCVDNAQIDYKDINRLSKYISDRGKIEPRRRTGVCAKHQRHLANAIKRARFLALLPYAPMHFGPVIEGRGMRNEVRAMEEKVVAKAEEKVEERIEERAEGEAAATEETQDAEENVSA
jgi:small subunit ribosomal protein S18